MSSPCRGCNIRTRVINYTTGASRQAQHDIRPHGNNRLPLRAIEVSWALIPIYFINTNRGSTSKSTMCCLWLRIRPRARATVNVLKHTLSS
eukprot:scaffold205_cov83-Skeletonema_dohrnii-CCMP3373.AAC.1